MREERSFEKYITPAVVIVITCSLAIVLWRFLVV